MQGQGFFFEVGRAGGYTKSRFSTRRLPLPELSTPEKFVGRNLTSSPICLDWWTLSKLGIDCSDGWPPQSHWEYLVNWISFQPIMWEPRDLPLRENMCGLVWCTHSRCPSLEGCIILQDPSNSRDFRFKLTYRTKPVMVFSVTYTICKGPKIHALEVSKCHVCWLSLWYYQQHK